jgi:hypothetical protein
MFAVSDVMNLLLLPDITEKIRTVFKEMRAAQNPRIRSAKNVLMRRCIGGKPPPPAFPEPIRYVFM